MPLRRFTGAWWSWIVLVGFTALNIALTAVVTNNLAERAIDADRRARAASLQASLTVLCDVITKQEAVFLESNTSVGRNAARAWHDLGITYRCY